MRTVVLLISCLWVSYAAAANYPVGSADEAEALRYKKPDWVELYYRELVKIFRSKYPGLYEIRLQDAHPSLWNGEEEKEMPP